MNAARPFRIQIEQAVLDDLQVRLQRARWVSVVTKTDRTAWALGTSPAFLQELVDYWRNGFNWRKQEGELNLLPQFKAKVKGMDIHFVHVASRARNPMPLLLLHGWPDSFYRYHKVIAPLSDPESIGGDPGDAFDIVVPSLPGFAFTEALLPDTQRPLRHTAKLLWRLMTNVLGYEQFAVAGGDGGSAIAQCLAIDYPEAVTGIHLTDIGWHATGDDAHAGQLSKAEQKYLAESKKYFLANSAYALLQMTRPRSLAAGLNDSPVGLASWIVDRFHSWSDGYIADRFSNDELLTNIMLYWVTQSIGSSILGYYEEARSPSLAATEHVDVPVAVALFPKDIAGIPPRSFAERTLNVQRWTEMPSGGHFAAWEVPDLYARDIVQFFRSLRTEDDSAAAHRGAGSRKAHEVRHVS